MPLNQNSWYTLYYSLMVPHTMGDSYAKQNTNPFFMLQKKAIRIANISDNYEPTKAVFIKLHTLKCCNLVDLYTAQMTYKAQNNS